MEGQERVPWQMEHPALYGVLAAVFMAIIGVIAFPGELWPLAVAPIVGLASWWAWRPGGPLSTRRLRRQSKS